MDWRKLARCADGDAELWFPVGDSGPALAQAAEAKAECAACPVKAECLEFALTMGLDHGIFGGLDAEERREVRRSRGDSAPAPARYDTGYRAPKRERRNRSGKKNGVAA